MSEQTVTGDEAHEQGLAREPGGAETMGRGAQAAMLRARTTTPAGPALVGPALVGAALVATVLVGCAGASDASPASELAGRTFESTGTTGHALADGTVVRLIVGEDGSVSVHAGCNSLFGAATWSDGTLDVPRLASTMMACDAGLAAQDRWLTAFLEGSPPFELDGDTLTLGDDEQIALTDVAAS